VAELLGHGQRPDKVLRVGKVPAVERKDGAFGGSNGLLGDLDEIAVQRLALGVARGVLDADVAAPGPLGVVGKADPDELCSPVEVANENPDEKSSSSDESVGSWMLEAVTVQSTRTRWPSSMPCALA
jgi:hypothetical protein